MAEMAAPESSEIAGLSPNYSSEKARFRGLMCSASNFGPPEVGLFQLPPDDGLVTPSG